MIIRFLLWLLVFMGAMWLWRRVQALLVVTGAPRRGPASRSAGRMVRDRVCQTFIAEENALQLAEGSEVRYFCSPACRDRYLAQKDPR